MSKKQAVAGQEQERERRISESQSDEDTKRRMDIALKMVDVQKQLLAAHPPTKVCVAILSVFHEGSGMSTVAYNSLAAQAIHGTMSLEVLEDAKVFMQEQLLRKAAQKRADKEADTEQQR